MRPSRARGHYRIFKMPELPEVELISRSLHSLVAGRSIVTAELFRDRLAPDTPPAAFSKQLCHTTINYIHRRGKHILFDLSGDKTLIVHLRMSGRFSLLNAETENPKFTHAVFHFDDDIRLVFDDQRHFGLMKIVRTGEPAKRVNEQDTGAAFFVELVEDIFNPRSAASAIFMLARRCSRPASIRESEPTSSLN